MKLALVILIQVGLLPWSVFLSPEEPPSPNRLTFVAQDCGSPLTARNFKTEALCTPPKAEQESAKREVEDAYILQKAEFVSRKAYRCHKMESRFDSICGAYSHTKIMAPPTIAQETMFSAETCAQTVASHIYIDETQKTHLLRVGGKTVLEYSYLLHGKLTYSHDNVYCRGDTGVMIHGEPRDGVVSMISTRVVVEPVTILVPADGSSPMDDTYKQLLPEKCRWSSSCNNGYVAYASTKEVFNKRVSCHWHLVRKLPLEVMTIAAPESAERKTAYLSRPANLLLPIDKQEVVIPGCEAVFARASTTIWPDLLVVMGLSASGDRDIKRLESRELRVDLSGKVRSEFQALITREQLNAALAGVTRQMCRFLSLSLHEYAPSPFSEGYLLHREGDLMTEVKCASVQVKALEGGDTCYSGAIVVQRGLEKELMLTGSRVLLKLNQLPTVPCELQEVTWAENVDGQLIAFQPWPTKEKVQLSPVSLLEKLRPHVHGELPWFNKGLYTQRQMNDFRRALIFNAATTVTVRRFTNQFCQGRGECLALAKVNSFNLADLTHPEDALTGLWGQLYQRLVQYGGLCSIILCGIYLGGGLLKIANVFVTWKEGYTLSTALRFQYRPIAVIKTLSEATARVEAQLPAIPSEN